MCLGPCALDPGLQAKYEQPVVTEVRRAAIFWPAEKYHREPCEIQTARRDPLA